MSSATVFPTAYIPSCFNKAAEFYSHEANKPLVASYRSLICNTCILAERIFRSFPPHIAYLSRTCLGYNGVFALYEYSQITNFIKSVNDCRIFMKNRKLLGTVLTAVKAYHKFVDIVLILGGAAVSFAAVAGFPYWLTAFYLFMRPFTLCSLTLSAISRLSDHRINTKLVSKTMPDHKLWVKAQREPWESKVLKENVKAADDKNQCEESFLKAKVEISRDEVIQFVVFQIILTVCAANPGTMLSAGLIWGNSIYLVHCAHRKASLGQTKFN